MQLCRIIYCSLTALHVSSDIFAHLQEHLNSNYSFWFYSRVSLSAAVSSRHTIKMFDSTSNSIFMEAILLCLLLNKLHLFSLTQHKFILI